MAKLNDTYVDGQLKVTGTIEANATKADTLIFNGITMDCAVEDWTFVLSDGTSRTKKFIIATPKE